MRLAASFFGRISLSNSRNPASVACLRDFCFMGRQLRGIWRARLPRIGRPLAESFIPHLAHWAL